MTGAAVLWQCVGVTLAEEAAVQCRIDPLTRLVHITYPVPAASPPEVSVHCSWAPTGTENWRPARVEPLLSDTAWVLLKEEDWRPWMNGMVLEHRAAGLERTVVFNPYPDAQENGMVDILFRAELQGLKGAVLSRHVIPVQVDNSDVIVIDDWHGVMQKDAIDDKPKAGCWQVQRGQPTAEAPFATAGTRLYGPGGADLSQLTYPLSLRGTYAVFVCSYGGVRLRLSGDERYDRLGSNLPFRERLWKWCRMDWQHLIVRQNYAYTGPTATSIDYVKLVPISPELAADLDSGFGTPDKIVASYWEPYSYAFSDNVQDAFWHREFLGAYREADVSIVDTQLGRFGMKVVFESRISDQLLYQTRGDPIGAVAHPTTTNVGRMQQYTNTLQASLKFGAELGLTVHANFGASNCYPGSPLQGDFSKQHPEWMRGAALRYEVPEVREFVLSLYREALEIGAPGISVDFCRYPEAIDSKDTCNAFLRELRALADEFGAQHDGRVPILTRFPAHGVRRSKFFDYPTWAREGWVDMLCPSSIQGRFHYFDVAPYQKAVTDTNCTLLPQIDALSWGLNMPGFFLWRAARLYEMGVPGIYIYQGDALIAHNPEQRRNVRLLRSSAAVSAYWQRDTEERPRCSKGIYITGFNQQPGYHRWERIHVWLEGIPMGEVEIYLDGKLSRSFAAPPYMFGEEDHSGDDALPRGEHDLKIRARDGKGWLERTFHVVSGG